MCTAVPCRRHIRRAYGTHAESVTVMAMMYQLMNIRVANKSFENVAKCMHTKFR
jgi:hypothetical protein